MLEKTTLTDKLMLPGSSLIMHLTRPNGYSYKPGQWCFLNLPDLGIDDKRGLRRHLSICTSPEENDLIFATKITNSAFKQTLSKIEIGQSILIEKPKGHLSLPKDTNIPICFLGGGIGVTPLRSLARHSTLVDSGHDITFIYSNRRPEDSPFLDEFEDMDSKYDSFKFIATMTRMNESDRTWSGREGRMDSTFIKEAFPSWNDGIFYVVGPPPMVETIVGMLAELKISQGNIYTEKFMGY